MNSSDNFPTSRIIDIKTGRPPERRCSEHSDLYMSDDKIYNARGEIVMQEPLDAAYDEHHAKLCDSIQVMLGTTVDSLRHLAGIACRDDKLLRSIKWKDQDGFTTTIPVALKSVRRDLEWLEQFFARGTRK